MFPRSGKEPRIVMVLSLLLWAPWSSSVAAADPLVESPWTVKELQKKRVAGYQGVLPRWQPIPDQ